MNSSAIETFDCSSEPDDHRAEAPDAGGADLREPRVGRRAEVAAADALQARFVLERRDRDAPEHGRLAVRERAVDRAVLTDRQVRQDPGREAVLREHVRRRASPRATSQVMEVRARSDRSAEPGRRRSARLELLVLPVPQRADVELVAGRERRGAVRSRARSRR